MKKTIFALIALFGAVGFVSGQRVKFYDIETELNVVRKTLRANASINLDFAAGKPEKLQFLLYKNAVVKSVSADGKPLVFNFDKTGASPNRYLKSAHGLTIETKNVQSAAAKIKIEYEYTIDDITSNANSISEKWTELGAYTAWFPVSFDYGAFTSRVRLKINDGFQVTGTGAVAKKGKYWELIQSKPDKDIVIVASNELKTKSYEFNGSKVRLDFVEIGDAEADQILATAKEFFGYYGAWFGDIERSNLTFAINPTKNKASYVRQGFVSIQTKDFTEKQLARMIGHELGHFWWNRGDTDSWEDWLNESFAEYSSLLAMQTRYGDDPKIEIEKYRAESKDAPPIRNLNRSDDKAFYVLYRKGPVILFELSEKIGAEQLKKLLKQTFTRKINSTTNFLQNLTEFASDENCEWFENRLKN